MHRTLIYRSISVSGGIIFAELCNKLSVCTLGQNYDIFCIYKWFCKKKIVINRCVARTTKRTVANLCSIRKTDITFTTICYFAILFCVTSAALNSKIDGNITSAQSYVKVMGDSYVKKIGNKVSLQIVAQSSSAFASGTKYHIADIPAEFRPKRRELTAAFANSSSTTGYGVAYMEIDVSGAINVQFATQAKNLLGHLEYFL